MTLTVGVVVPGVVLVAVGVVVPGVVLVAVGVVVAGVVLVLGGVGVEGVGAAGKAQVMIAFGLVGEVADGMPP